MKRVLSEADVFSTIHLDISSVNGPAIAELHKQQSIIAQIITFFTCHFLSDGVPAIGFFFIPVMISVNGRLNSPKGSML